MRSPALAVLCLAAAGCSASSGTDESDVFTGSWTGQGLSVWTSALPTYALPGPGVALAAPSPSLLSFGTLSFTADGAGGVGLAGLPGVALPFPDVVPMRLEASRLILPSAFTASRPAPASCADTPCEEQTDVLTVAGGWAAVADGELRVAFTGQRVLCCTSEAFTVAFVGARAGQASPR